MAWRFIKIHLQAWKHKNTRKSIKVHIIDCSCQLRKGVSDVNHTWPVRRRKVEMYLKGNWFHENSGRKGNGANRDRAGRYHSIFKRSQVVFSLHIITQFQSSHVPFLQPHSFGQQMDQFRAAAACSFSEAIYRAQMLKIGMAVSCHDNLMYCF